MFDLFSLIEYWTLNMLTFAHAYHSLGHWILCVISFVWVVFESNLKMVKPIFGRYRNAMEFFSIHRRESVQCSITNQKLYLFYKTAFWMNKLMNGILTVFIKFHWSYSFTFKRGHVIIIINMKFSLFFFLQFVKT